MPADYRSAAAALSLPPSPIPSPRPDGTDSGASTPSLFRRSSSRSPPGAGAGAGAPPRPPPDTTKPLPRPPWAVSTATSARRLSSAYHGRGRRSASGARRRGGGGGDLPLHTQLVRTAAALARRAAALFGRLTPLQRVLVCLGVAALAALGVLGLVFSHAIFGALGPVAKGWRDLPGGWAILFLLTAATGFPPLIGYSSACTLAGFVYGFPAGWPVVAGASVAGSLGAFYTSRTVFAGYVHRLVGRDRRFVALGQVLRRDGLGVLALVRFCPLPFSLSNGFLATIPSVSPWAFALATALASPKLLVPVFVGSRLAKLAEEGDSMSLGDRAINYVGMLVGALVGVSVGYVIYRRTMARAAELAREELEGAGGGGAGGADAAAAGAAGAAAGYVDGDSEDGEDARLMAGADEDAAALMDADDISLWEAANGLGDGAADDDDDGEGRYRDAFADADGAGQPDDEESGLDGRGRR